MDNNTIIEDPKKETIELQKNYEDEYWSKQYGVSVEELKKTDHHIGLSDKIIQAAFKKKVYSV